MSSIDVNQQSLAEAQVLGSNVSFPISTAATRESYGVSNPTITTLERSDSEPVSREEFRSSIREIKDTLAVLALSMSEMSSKVSTISDALRIEAQQRSELDDKVQNQFMHQQTQLDGVLTHVMTAQQQFVELQTIVQGAPLSETEDGGYSMAKRLKSLSEDLMRSNGRM